jgi:hypothetical protein
MLRAPGIGAKVEIVYQSVEGLHQACPGHTGDWYFTGNYPTPGGNRVVNRAFVNYMEGNNQGLLGGCEVISDLILSRRSLVCVIGAGVGSGVV